MRCPCPWARGPGRALCSMLRDPGLPAPASAGQAGGQADLGFSRIYLALIYFGGWGWPLVQPQAECSLR